MEQELVLVMEIAAHIRREEKLISMAEMLRLQGAHIVQV